MISVITYSNSLVEAEKIIEVLFSAGLIAFGEVSEKTTFYAMKGNTLEKKERVTIRMMTRALFFDDILALLKKKISTELNTFSFPLALTDVDSATVIRALKE